MDRYGYLSIYFTVYGERPNRGSLDGKCKKDGKVEDDRLTTVNVPGHPPP